MPEDTSQEHPLADRSRSLGQQYCPLSPTHTANPYAFYAQARKEEPIFFSPIMNAWVVSRYEDCLIILKDHQRFAGMTVQLGYNQLTPEVQTLLRTSASGKLPTALSSLEPPEHTRLRGSVAKAFTAQHLVSMEPQVRTYANQLIDRCTPWKQMDVVEHFTTPYPIMVIGDLLKIPEADRELLQHWTENVMTLLFASPPHKQQLACAQEMVAMFSYVRDLVEERRKEPQDDLISILVQKGGGGQTALSPVEVTGMLRFLLLAGIEEPFRFLSNCLFHLLEHRSHWEALVQNPELIPQFVEEGLRFDGSSLGVWRIAKEDVVIKGKYIPKGARIQVLQSSANHDEAIFSHPEIFDPFREGLQRHIAFGQGIHTCLGASLVRLEVRVALEQLSQRLPSLRLVPHQRLNYSHSLVSHGIEQLLVEWECAL